MKYRIETGAIYSLSVMLLMVFWKKPYKVRTYSFGLSKPNWLND